MTVKIYHNPRCSKSRQTLALLEEKGITPEIVEYLKSPPSKDELSKVLKALNIPATSLLRTKEALFKELVEAPSELTDTQALALMTEHPKLIERPIVVNGEVARIGRPPEQVLEIL